MNKLYSVSKGIPEFKRLGTWKRKAFENLDSATSKLFKPDAEIIDSVSDMSFCFCTIDTVLDSYVKLERAHLQPKATVLLAVQGFLDFQQSQEHAIELSGRSFGIFRDGDLSVIDSEDHEEDLKADFGFYATDLRSRFEPD